MRRLALLLGAIFLSGCHPIPTASGPLPQRGYLWQRSWTPAVQEAFRVADARTDGVVVLGEEILWDGQTPRPVIANIAWDELKAARKPCAIGLRIAPYPGPFADDDAPARAIAAAAKQLVGDAQAHGVNLRELQIDFDCAADRLDGYRTWVTMLKKAVPGTRLVITTLPAWLKESAFAPLVRAADGYVLQVHSVPTLAESGHSVLCDPALARKWVEQAARLGVPFSVALPTYRCTAGYGPDGKLLGVAMDSVDPAWPPGTRLLKMAANADELSALIKEWQTSRPADLQEVIWYRLPVATDLRNWRWPTLAAVMAGRPLAHHLEVRQSGDNPIDLALANTGEAEEPLNADVTVRWKSGVVVTGDAMPGWTFDQDREQAVFRAVPHSSSILLPGEKIDIGWIRFEKTTGVEVEISRPAVTPP